MLNKPKNDKPAEEECKWGLHCPICANSAPNPKAGSSEDWRQDNLQWNYYTQSPQYSPAYHIQGKFYHQYKLEKEWNERMEYCNDKYNLDYCSSSNSKFEFELEQNYKTLI